MPLEERKEFQSDDPMDLYRELPAASFNSMELSSHVSAAVKGSSFLEA